MSRALLVGRMALGNVRGRDRRSSAAADSLVVVAGSLVADSLVGEEEHRRVVVEGGCWYSLARKGIAGHLERSWVEEDIAVGHRAVEGDNHPVVDHHRSNRYLTL